MRGARDSNRHLGHCCTRLGARLLAVTLMALCLAAPATAQGTDSRKLEDVERALAQDRSRADALTRAAEALKLEIRMLRAESIAAARQAQSREDRLSEIESRLAVLERQETAKRAQLRSRHQQLTGTLAALQRIALVPPEALLAAPGSPVETVRSAMLLRVAIPAIESRASLLRGELAALARLHQQIALRQHELPTAAQDLETERARLGALIERKRAARAAATSEQRAAQERANKLAAQAKDLRDLLARLEREGKERRERVAREEAARQARKQAERQARELAERAALELAGRQARERAEAQARALAQRQAREQAARAAEAREETTQLALARPDNVRPFPDAGASLRMPARGPGRAALRTVGRHGGHLQGNQHQSPERRPGGGAL